jgi:peptide/nickel transport system permease protein
MRNWLTGLKRLRRYPSMMAGVVIIAIFVGVSLYTMIAIPIHKAEDLWTGRLQQQMTQSNPKNAVPIWFNWFRSDKLPSTITVDSATGAGIKTATETGNGTVQLDIVLPFRYTYTTFPQELRLYSVVQNTQSPVLITVSWTAADGRTILLQENRPVTTANTYYISQDRALYTQLSNELPHVGLFANPQNPSEALEGDYQVAITAEIPQGATLNSKLVVYGKVFGLAGTDNQSRDLMIALLWGAPIALMFGVVAAVGTGLLTFLLAAIGTWMGGKTDRAFQWITQVNLIVPVLPVLIMVAKFYSSSLFLTLGVIIALSIFGSSMLTNRAMFLQAMEAPYIEAAQAYGANSFRVIFRYLMPRIAPTLLPQFVLIVPTFVFLEATLAVLGLGDPHIPTWGKLLNDAYSAGAMFKGYYYWFIEPAVLLMILGIGFSLIGYSLDRVFNPRLRSV